MNKFNKIYLSWRKSKSQARIIVGELLLTDGDDVTFRYINLNQAIPQGFAGYPGLSINKQVHPAVLDLFSKRLINTNRSDSNSLLDFWEIAPEFKINKLYVLAMTQGMTPIDNFEFLADFQLEEGLHFVTDIAGLSHSQFSLSKLKVGGFLSFKKEKHPKDEYAVKALFNNDLVGYVKKGHNLLFHQLGSENLQIQVKQITNNPEDRKLFVRIFI